MLTSPIYSTVVALTSDSRKVAAKALKARRKRLQAEREFRLDRALEHFKQVQAGPRLVKTTR